MAYHYHSYRNVHHEKRFKHNASSFVYCAWRILHAHDTFRITLRASRKAHHLSGFAHHTLNITNRQPHGESRITQFYPRIAQHVIAQSALRIPHHASRFTQRDSESHTRITYANINRAWADYECILLKKVALYSSRLVHV